MLTSTAVLALTPLWTMMLGGDIMLNQVSHESKPLISVASLFEGSDFAYANVEIPLTDGKSRTARKTAAELRARSQYILKADPRHISSLTSCGFDTVSLGNNHAMDYGVLGLRQMQSLLTANNILYCGAGENRQRAAEHAAYTTRDGVRIGMLSFLAFQTQSGRWKCTPATSSSAGVAEITLDPRTILSIVKSVRSQCDLVAVALHWGLEKHTAPSAYQVKLGRAFVDAGADLVIGSHPHVLQGAEMYRSKPILYSLGNLVSPRPGSTGLIRLTYSGTGLKQMQFLPCVISRGSVKPVTKGVDFGRLCALVARKYPSKWSRQPRIR